MIGERTIALVPLGMDQHIKNFTRSIHGTPEIDQTTVDLEIDLVEMPHGMWLRPAFAKIDRDLDPKWVAQRRTIS
jgi:hypothetical protein